MIIRRGFGTYGFTKHQDAFLTRSFVAMRWWPFRKGRGFAHNEPHIRGSKMWIQDLREACEKGFNDREAGQAEVDSMREEWKKSYSLGEVEDSLFEGLERRATLLLSANDSEWLLLLDNEDFWKVGWGSKVED
ncbi:MAG: hypothetical protein CMA12_04425 [Euryarchaeota archaeon]|nr:hypothetical protein [Euryarchaeota archaeon]